MGKTADTYNLDTSSHCFCKISLLCVVCVSSVICIQFGFSPFLVTVTMLCLSTLFLLTVSKRKSIENQQKVNPEAVTFCNAAEQNVVSDFHDYQVESADCPSASESSDDFPASEGFGLNWACFNKLGKNVAVSEILVSSDDDYDEDEDDNLIEISLPDNSSSVELNEEIVKTGEKLQMELPEFMFRQEGFVELMKEINEVNEEENLIEIDICMGSIKGQHFQEG